MLGKTACQYLLEETEHQDTVVNMLLQNKKNQSQELKPVRSWKWAIDIYIYKARGSDSGFCIHRTGPMNQNETKPRFISFLEILVRDSVGCGPHDVVCLLFFFFFVDPLCLQPSLCDPLQIRYHTCVPATSEHCLRERYTSLVLWKYKTTYTNKCFHNDLHSPGMFRSAPPGGNQVCLKVHYRKVTRYVFKVRHRKVTRYVSKCTTGR